MSRKAHNNRGETLRAVINTASVRRDGLLPMDVEDVDRHFTDELDLLAALTLKWHTRLAGQIEQMLAQQPLDLERAVAIAWSNTAHELAGVRLIIDHYAAIPIDDAMARTMATASAKERYLLAVMSGRAGIGDHHKGAQVGADIEERARTMHRGTPLLTADVLDALEEEPVRRLGLRERLRAVVAA